VLDASSLLSTLPFLPLFFSQYLIISYASFDLEQLLFRSYRITLITTINNG